MGAIGHGWLASHIQSTVLCFFLIKCYQNTPILTSLHIVYGCFYILTAGLSSCHRNHMAHNIYSQTLYRKVYRPLHLGKYPISTAIVLQKISFALPLSSLLRYIMTNQQKRHLWAEKSSQGPSTPTLWPMTKHKV